MKKRILQILFILALLFSFFYGLLSYISKQVLVKKIDRSIQKILTTDNNENIENDNLDLSAAYFFNILELNIYKHNPQLSKKYDTELKRKKYEETDDYKTQFKKIENEKKYILNQEYNLIINQFVELSNYVINDGGFYLSLPYSNGYWTYYDAIQMNSYDPAISSINGFMFNAELRYDKNSISNNEIYYSLFIKCDEDTALEIEENSNSIELLLKFMINVSGHKIGYNINVNNGQQYNPHPLVMTKSVSLEFKSNNRTLYEIKM